MSTPLRIKNTHLGKVDEFVTRLDEDGNRLGDDVTAKDINDITSALLDIEKILLTINSSRVPSGLIDPSKGIAQRILELESVIGKTTLQDTYTSGDAGNKISILPSRPLIFGSMDEFVLDDMGNLALKPATFRILDSTKTKYLKVGYNSLSALLTGLTIETATLGESLKIKSAGPLSLQDNFLRDPVTLSDENNPRLETISTSLVGAINELKNSSFALSMSTAYHRGNNGIVVLSEDIGSIVFRAPFPGSLMETFWVDGRMKCTDRFSAKNIEISDGETSIGANGIRTKQKIKTDASVEASLIDAEFRDLSLKDQRLTVKLSDGTNTRLSTISQSLVGSINELNAKTTNIGNNISNFDKEHDVLTGAHKSITVKSPTPASETLEKISIKDSMDSLVFAVNGKGHLVAKEILLNGESLLLAMSRLESHILNDGRAHSLFNLHLTQQNPHNVVGSINGIFGDLTLQASNGLDLSIDGKNISITNTKKETLESVYLNSPLKEMTLTSALSFVNALDELIFLIDQDKLTFKKEVEFGTTTGQVGKISPSTTQLSLEATVPLRLKTTNSLFLETAAGETVDINGVKFGDPITSSLPEIAGNSVLSSIRNLSESNSIIVTCPYPSGMMKVGDIVSLNPSGIPIYPATDIHPYAESSEGGGELEGLFFVLGEVGNLGATSIAQGSSCYLQATGKVTKSVGLDSWQTGDGVYLEKKPSTFIEIKTTSVLPGKTITIGGKTLTSTSNVGSTDPSEFLGTGMTTKKQLAENIIDTINSLDWHEISPVGYFRAKLDGDFSSISISIETSGSGKTLTIGGVNTTLVSSTIGDILSEISKIPSLVGFDQQIIGNSLVLTVVNLEFPLPVISASSGIIVSSVKPEKIGIRIYREGIQNISTAVSTNDASSFGLSGEIGPETQQLISGRIIHSKTRKNRFERKIKIGSVVECAGSIIKILMK